VTAAAGSAAPHARQADSGAIGTASANLLWARALVEGLVAGGVRHACLSPGSRSSPLALAVNAEKRIALCTQIDERSAAFFALGIAKATRTPVALICTSGTAAANYFPAVVEASLAGVALVVLTADRPAELRGTGASQTIDQVRLYGAYPRLFRDLPCPDDPGSRPAAAAEAAYAACDAAMTAPVGPAHLNVPFREPLVPSPAEMAASAGAWAAIVPALRQAISLSVAEPAAAAVPALPVLAALAGRIDASLRPLIVAGPEGVAADEAQSVLAFARATGIPVFADIASGLRFSRAAEGVTLCAHADLFLRDEALAAIAPDFVLRLGGIPTSKTLATYLARHRPVAVAVQPDERRRDPDGIVHEVIVAKAGALCGALASLTRRTRGQGDAWPALIRIAEAGARELAAKPPQEAAAVVAACSVLPPGGALFLSSSMPIRWAEMYVPESASGVRVFVNRGANGIDGIVSTALGAARGSGLPMLLVAGDLAFLHDLGGLRSARELRGPAVILVLNNDGGGIFSHLPIAQHADAFEPLFGTPHGCDLALATQAFGVEHRLAATDKDVAALASEAFAAGTVRVIEVRTDRAQAARDQADLARLPGLHAERASAGGIAWNVRSRGPRAGLPLVLLHGFTGTGEFWAPVAGLLPGRRCIFPDLPGHGGSDMPLPPEAWRIDRTADALVALLGRLGVDRCALAGYSMGGRLALGVALRHPDRVAALALIGASAGIASEEERLQRAASDLELAASIEREDIESFATRWEANPLFATQAALPPALHDAMRRQRRAQDPMRLAAALRAFGTGFQPPAHGELAQLRMPVLLMAGEQDAKFVAAARDMAARIPGAQVRIIAGAGHAVPLERARECALEIDAFLTRSHSA
jgi:2-succinyl-5-enolpyruvyl-6-hydroxy-3-cyclohexene-1-carboxylate synthase